jgi:hypothetical protein
MDPPNLDWIDLSDLPDDLKTEILSREKSAHSKLPYITKGIKSTSNYHWLRTTCLQPISDEELDKYKELYNPITICQLASYVDNDGIYYVGIFLVKSFMYENYQYGQSHIYGKYVEDDFIGLGDQVENSVVHIEGRDHNYESRLYDGVVLHGYDLITTYYVLKSRQSCANINEGFAKRVVIDILEEMDDRYTKYIEKHVKRYKETAIEVNDDIGWNDIFGTLYDYYTYLRCNAMMMGINIITKKHNDINPSFDDLNKFNKNITNLIEITYPKVHLYLENIDDTQFIDKEYRYVLVGA